MNHDWGESSGTTDRCRKCGCWRHYPGRDAAVVVHSVWSYRLRRWTKPWAEKSTFEVPECRGIQ